MTILIPRHLANDPRRQLAAPILGVYYSFHDIIGRRATPVELTQAFAKLRPSNVGSKWGQRAGLARGRMGRTGGGRVSSFPFWMAGTESRYWPERRASGLICPPTQRCTIGSTA